MTARRAILTRKTDIFSVLGMKCMKLIVSHCQAAYLFGLLDKGNCVRISYGRFRSQALSLGNGVVSVEVAYSLGILRSLA